MAPDGKNDSWFETDWEKPSSLVGWIPIPPRPPGTPTGVFLSQENASGQARLSISVSLFLLALAFALLAFCSGCASKKSGLKVSGPEASIIHGEFNRLCAELGHDPGKVGKGRSLVQRYSTPSGADGNQEYTCDAAGCWYGIFRDGKTIEYPPRRLQSTVAHETLHAIILYLDNGVPGTETTYAHPAWLFRKDGTRVKARDLVRGKWPSAALDTIPALWPGGKRPQDIWTDQWEFLKCGLNPAHINPVNPAP